MKHPPPPAKRRGKAPIPPHSRLRPIGWLLGAAIAVGLVVFAVSRHRPEAAKSAHSVTNRGGQPLTNVAITPIAVAGPEAPTFNPSSAPPQAGVVSTNSPLQDPNFKIPDDPVQLLNYGTELLDRGWIDDAI